MAVFGLLRGVLRQRRLEIAGIELPRPGARHGLLGTRAPPRLFHDLARVIVEAGHERRAFRGCAESRLIHGVERTQVEPEVVDGELRRLLGAAAAALSE